MPNIFDGIKMLSDNELIEQIALLETINMYNISKPIAQKAIKKAVNLINFLGNKIGKDPNIKEPEVKEIWMMLEEKIYKLKEYTREELNETLKGILIEKSKNKEDNPSEDEISVKVIEEASKLYKVNEKLTPGKKADIIYLNYSQKNNEDTQSSLKEENIKEVEYIILNGEDDKSIELVETGEREKEIKSDKTSILNSFSLRNLDKDMLAKIVYIAVENYGKQFTPKDQDMPSYVSNEEKEAIIKNEQAFKVLKEELVKANKEVNKLIDEIEKIDSRFNKENKYLTNKMEIMENVEIDIIKLEKLKSSLEEERILSREKLQVFEEERKNINLGELDLFLEEYEKVKLKIFDFNNEINNLINEITYKNELGKSTYKEISEKEEIIRKLAIEKEKTLKEKETVQEIYLLKKEEVNNIKSQRRSEILRRWEKVLSNFIVQEDNIKNIVDFNIDELIEIEKCLYELNFTEDPQALSIGFVKEGREKYDYIETTSNNGFNFEIWFKVLENGKIHIVEING